MSALSDTALAATRFARTRWGWRWRNRAALLAWQERCLRRFLRDRLPLAPYYAAAARHRVDRGVDDPALGDPGVTERNAADRRVFDPHADLRLADLPIVDKRALLTHFDALNTRGIRYDDAIAVALAAERSRDFRPEIGDITVGLSSGTSGQRALFLVSRRERLLWAGSMLARTLSSASLAQIASPWRPPLAVAFFLRANSNLYATLHSGRVAFSFHDLLQPLETHVAALTARAPDVLVAPATVLRRLAEVQHAGALDVHPRQVISVAETLEPEDAAVVRQAFGCRVQQIYQATEGFLGYTCPAGTLHLNEECVHIEPEWLDAARTRFHPIVTDFTRETQLIVRYRLDDVLRLKEGGCACGRVSVALAGVDGRRDAVLVLPARHDGTPRAIFPDVVRRAMMLAGDRVRDYRIVQTEAGLVVRLCPVDREAAGADVARGDVMTYATKSSVSMAQHEAARDDIRRDQVRRDDVLRDEVLPDDVTDAVRAELASLFAQQEVVAPSIAFLPWQNEAAGDKCCRIRRLAPTPTCGGANADAFGRATAGVDASRAVRTAPVTASGAPGAIS